MIVNTLDSLVVANRNLRHTGFVNFHKFKDARVYENVNNVNYIKINYERKLGLAARAHSLGLAILATLSIIPLFVNFKYVTSLWNQVDSGIEHKVVLCHPQAYPQSLQKFERCINKSGENPTGSKPKGVAFKEARERKFLKDAPPEAVGELNSEVYSVKA